jgi:hypothetical protein
MTLRLCHSLVIEKGNRRDIENLTALYGQDFLDQL